MTKRALDICGASLLLLLSAPVLMAAALAQLVNVLREKMSLFGPRPALPAEAQQGDEEPGRRSTVMPGLTGPREVEARDDPSFDRCRELDCFYAENWSL